jgi:translation initiation factor 2 gamma subunit (eIF-2gamma)
MDVGIVVSRSMEGLMERQHRRYSTLDWPTHEELMKAHRLRGAALRNGVIALARVLRALAISISKPDVHRKTVPIPLVGGTKARGGAIGD